MREIHTAVMAVMVFGLFSGCVIIPVPRGGHTGVYKAIDEEAVKFIQIGTTTREDVLLRLGAPDSASENTLEYGIEKSRWSLIVLFFIPIPNPVGFGSSRETGGVITWKTYRPLIIEVDENSIVTGWRFGEGETRASSE